MMANTGSPQIDGRTGTLSRETIVVMLTDLFRTNGFEGVSIASIAKATGIGKSSLYHHFPGGKDEMATAVMEAVGSWVAQNLVEPLLASGTRQERIDAMLENVTTLYDGGNQPCVIASMMVGAEAGPVFPAIRAAFADWMNALQQALQETGASPTAAREAAQDAIARLQGALLLCRALDDRAPFAAALIAARRDLIAA